MDDPFADLPPPSASKNGRHAADGRTSDPSSSADDKATTMLAAEPNGATKRAAASVSVFDDLPPPKRMSGEPARAEPAALEAAVPAVEVKRTVDTRPPVQPIVYAASRRGRREQMQDAYITLNTADVKDKWSAIVDKAEISAYAAVFDGHGGSNAATHARDYLHGHLFSSLTTTLARPLNSTDAAIRESFQTAFHRTDKEFLAKAAEHGWRDGSTALVALVQRHRLYLANLGDCKAVLAIQKNHAGAHSLGPHTAQAESVQQPTSPAATVTDGPYQALELTKDHNPIVWEERQRIQRAGGTVTDNRVLGQLEVSRALGDGRFKTVGVIATPEVFKRSLNPGDAFVLLACDGLFKGLTSTEAVQFVGRELAKDAPSDGTPKGQAAVMALVNEAIRQGSTDNVTCILLLFDPALK